MAEETWFRGNVIAGDYASLILFAVALLAALSVGPRTERALLLGQEANQQRILPVIVPPKPATPAAFVPETAPQTDLGRRTRFIARPRVTPEPEPGLRPIPLVFEPQLAPPIQLGPITPFGLSVPFANTNQQDPNAPQTGLESGTILAAVPEPATWVTLIFGFFGIGLVLRRSKRREHRGDGAGMSEPQNVAA